MSGRRVTKQARPVAELQPERSTVDQRVLEEGLVEVINNQRGREQNVGWGVYRSGKVYIVGTSKAHALLNLAQGRKVLNIPDP